MAEFVMKDLLLRAERTDVAVESAALHTDELGNDIHHGTRSELKRHGIPFVPRSAWLLSALKAAEYGSLQHGRPAANRLSSRQAEVAQAPCICRERP